MFTTIDAISADIKIDDIVGIIKFQNDKNSHVFKLVYKLHKSTGIL